MTSLFKWDCLVLYAEIIFRMDLYNASLLPANNTVSEMELCRFIGRNNLQNWSIYVLYYNISNISNIN